MINDIRVLSEIGELKRVVIHRPDKGIEYVTPSNKNDLLYDDIVFLRQMQEEHDVFANLLHAVLGKDNVVDIEDLLADVLKMANVRKEIVSTICSFEGCERYEESLLSLCPSQLATVLISGTIEGQEVALFQPVANYIFCRDIAAIIDGHVLLGQAARRVRARESILTRFIFEHHKYFNGYSLIQMSSMADLKSAYSDGYNPLSLEGGDVMILGRHILIGCSERTSVAAFHLVKHKILNQGLAESVIQIEMPKERFCMHLDTVISMVDTDECIVFNPLIMTAKLQVTQHFNASRTRTFKNLKDLITHLSPSMSFIPCGNGIAPFDEREQWTDACNILTLKPGVAIMYDRNVRTLQAFRQRGYEIVSAFDFTASASASPSYFQSVSKTVISVPSNELSRARGGPHCLSLPLLRL